MTAAQGGEAVLTYHSCTRYPTAAGSVKASLKANLSHEGAGPARVHSQHGGREAAAWLRNAVGSSPHRS